MTLKVLEPGLYTLVVDYGRPQCRSLGVPVGGAADRAALALGNALVGNPPDAPALEFSLSGPTLQSDIPLACVVFGAPFQIHCSPHRLGRAEFRKEPGPYGPRLASDLEGDCRPIPMGKTFALGPEEILHIAGTPVSMRAYLCVRGGLHTPRILDSYSRLERLRAGAELPCTSATIPSRFLFLPASGGRQPPEDSFLSRFHNPPPPVHTLRVVDGLQADWFCTEEFYSQEMLVSPDSNRMGLRLHGRPLTLPKRELLSEPVCPGAVQVTRDGQCIILGVDGQTIGGYPKIAQVISADLDVLGQLRPGEHVRFAPVTPEEAVALYRQGQAHLQEWIHRLQVTS